MTEQLPALKGLKDPEKESEAAKHEQALVREQLKQMDIDIPNPPEVVTPSRDVQETMDTAARTVEAEGAIKKKVSEKKLASLEKARTARAEKKRLRDEGQDLASEPDKQPQLLVDIQKLIDDRFERFTQSLQDLRAPIASEDPLPTTTREQPQQKRIRTIESEAEPSSKLELATPDNRPEILPMYYKGPVYHPPNTPRPQLSVRSRTAERSSRPMLLEDSNDARVMNQQQKQSVTNKTFILF